MFGTALFGAQEGPKMFGTDLSGLDVAVLVGYFVLMTLIGIYSMWKVKKQEDYFMGSRGFGKVLQMFAAFGAGTNAGDPVAVGRTTFMNGLSGIWSVFLWLFVTPFYWIAGVWYRRMRHLTLGDWFVERYQSKSMGIAYTLFGIFFYMIYLGVGFSALGKVGAPLVNVDQIPIFGMEIDVMVVLVLLTASTVLVYGVLGGLRAAYLTDFVQGVFIILLSVLLIPVGLNALVKEEQQEKQAVAAAAQEADIETEKVIEGESDPQERSFLYGFNIMHQRVPGEYFQIFESPRGGEFPLHYIVLITILNLLGIVVQPHFIAVGGGSAKTETNARFGLVAGNFLKRFCTVGWALTALIVLALMANNLELAQDPDRVWGVAARELLGPLNLGLVGLMLACLLAALMSSASCYMLVVSALVVRNVYAEYFQKDAKEWVYVLLGRIFGAVLIIGAATFSILNRDVFDQLKLSWELPIIFAAPFWVGLYWRYAGKWAAWLTILFSFGVFFLMPLLIPQLQEGIKDNPRFLTTNDFVTTYRSREASMTDVLRREAAIKLWERNAEEIRSDEANQILTEQQMDNLLLERIGRRPQPVEKGDTIEDTFETGGKGIYWRRSIFKPGGVVPVNEQGQPLVINDQGKVVAKKVEVKDEQTGETEIKTVPVEDGPVLLEEISRKEGEEPNTTVVRRRYKDNVRLRGEGNIDLDFLLYEWMGVPLQKVSTATLETLRLPTRLVLPFVVIVLLSFITPNCSKETLDRYYVKMKTPVDPDPEEDKKQMELSYAHPDRYENKRLIKWGGLEFSRPTFVDIAGFIGSFLVCFAIIWLVVWLANYQL